MNFSLFSLNQPPLKWPIVFGHYVPWYTLNGSDFPLHPDDARTLDWMPELENNRHWRDPRAGYGRTHLHMPEPGPYDARDPEIIHWQIEQALQHGIDGFWINWYGKYSAENIITLHFLRALDTWNKKNPTHPFGYGICIDSQSRKPSEGKRVAALDEDLLYIKDHLTRPGMLLRDDRFIFPIFPYEADCCNWHGAMTQVFGEHHFDLIWMNTIPNENETAVFPWVAPNQETVHPEHTPSWTEPDSNGVTALGDFFKSANEQGQHLKYLMGGVWPGFNDTLVSWAWHADHDPARVRPRVICRDTSAGNTFELTWKANLDYIRSCKNNTDKLPMPIIQVITWNDYAEASEIEPTRDFNNKLLTLCRDLRSI